MEKIKIQIVEDEVVTAIGIEAVLKNWGYEVTSIADNSDSAIENVFRDEPDLILMDIRLKGDVDGIVTAQKIKTEYNIPVIFLTAHVDDNLMKRAKIVLPSGYLIKPVKNDLLKATIEIALHMAKMDEERSHSEKELSKSESKWRSLTEHSPDHIFELDKQLNIVFSNHPFMASSITKSLRDLTSLTINRVSTKSILTGVLETGNPATFEIEIESEKVTKIYFELRATAIKKAQSGVITGVTVCARDITAHKIALLNLRDKETWLLSAFQQAAVGIIHTDLKGKFKMVNQRYCQIVGYSEQELLEKSFTDLTHPAFLEQFQENLSQLLKGNIEAFNLRKKNYRKDGSLVWVNLTINLVRNEDGPPEFLHGIVEDITILMEAKQALQESGAKYQDLYDNTPDMHISVDAKTTLILECNQMLLTMTGFKKDSLIGRSILSLFTPKSTNTLNEKVYPGFMKNGVIKGEDLQLLKSNGNILDVSLNCSSVNDSAGNILYGRWSLHDITDQKQLESRQNELELQVLQLQKMEAIGTIAGGVAHDFNNILHPIIGLSTLGEKNTEIDSKLHKYFISIHQAATRAKKLVQQILSFSRKSESNFEIINLHSVLSEVLKMLRPTLPVTIEIETDVNKKCGTILANATQIHQVIMNLVTNAYQAMQESVGTLSISLKPALIKLDNLPIAGMLPGQYACLTVSDTGEGIPANLIDKIFDPYFTTKDMHKGTGLGLSVVLGVIKSHKGSIKVSSEPGVGTSFDIYLPESIEDIPIKDVKHSSKTFQGEERILIVDDETEIVYFQTEALKQFGYSISATTESVKALDMVKKNPGDFDMVITDMTMPHLTGYDLAQKLLEIRPDLPIILITGYSDSVDKEKATAIGIKRFMQKPVDQDDLVAAIRDVFNAGDAKIIE